MSAGGEPTSARVRSGGDDVEPLVEVRDLGIIYRTSVFDVEAVRDASFSLQLGEIVGIVGESGAGKTAIGRGCSGLLADNAELRGSVRFSGKDMTDERSWSRVRGDELGVVFQDPNGALNPVLTVRTQMVEAVRAHRNLSRAEAMEEAITALREVGIPDAASRVHQYPYQFSGGMRQRIGLAMALLNKPSFLVADEPTTALDVTIQAQILDLLMMIKRERNLAVLLITHDMGVVARTCDRVFVMYGGRIVERGHVSDIFSRPRHPYTKALLDAVPDADAWGKLPSPIHGSPFVSSPGEVGCPFRDRCPKSTDHCDEDPPTVDFRHGQQALCWHPLEQ